MPESPVDYQGQHQDNAAAAPNTENQCSCCQVECEMEWRTRISLADAQRIILQHFRGKPDVWIDEYRVKRFAQYQRRVGARSHYARYRFSTIGDFLSLHGLAPLYSTSTVNDIACPEGAASTPPGIRTYPFSELKTTNCAHTFYTFSTTSSLQKNTAWPRIFVFKRSLEIGDFEMDYDDNGQAGFEEKTPFFLDEAVPPAFSAAIDNVFANYERTELDRSDNNLGVAYIRKMYRFIPLPGPLADKENPLCHRDNGGMLRLAVYSIFDEYQQIRHEVGVEYEFDCSECQRFNDKLAPPDSTMPGSTCASSSRCYVSIGASRLDTLLMAMSQIVDDFVVPYVDCVGKPMVKINVDWLEGITSLSKIRMLSYTIPGEQVENETNFVDYVMRRLAALAKLAPAGDRRSEQSGLIYHYFLRRKLDGERLYATYDGGHWLCMSNGMRLDLRHLSFRGTAMATALQCGRMTADDVDKACRALFSVDFIYQIERVDKDNYYLTEVVAIRHSYSTVLSSLVHTFSPSRNFYRATDEQVWPYALIGTGLDDHATSSLINFWVTSACHDTSGFLTRDLVDTLREERRMLANLQRNSEHDPALNAEKKTRPLVDDDTLSHDSSDNFTAACQSIKHDSLSPAKPPCGQANKDKEAKDAGLFPRAMPSSSLSALSDTAGSGGDDSLTQNEENDRDDTNKSVAHSDGESPLKTYPGKEKKSAGVGSDNGTMPNDAYSRFFVPVSARDSRRYLTALSAMLCPSVKKQHQGICRGQTTLRVNAPITIDSLSRQELRHYYRSYITRILNVLFLCGEHSRCRDYAYKHFSGEYAAQVCAAYLAQHRCQDTHFLLESSDDNLQDSLTIDGYLLYREQANTLATSATDYCCSKRTSPCAMPVPLIDRSGVTTVLKLKPFQTIELLMRVNLVCTAEVNYLSSIQFLSQWCPDGSPSVFFTCTFMPGQNGEQPVAEKQDSQPDSKDDRRQRLCVMEPDFKLARWTRYDGKTMKVFADPRLELVDGLVYEFLCYNELELYLLEARPDKVLPDDEIKINSILWGRHSSDAFFAPASC